MNIKPLLFIIKPNYKKCDARAGECVYSFKKNMHSPAEFSGYKRKIKKIKYYKYLYNSCNIYKNAVFPKSTA